MSFDTYKHTIFNINLYLVFTKYKINLNTDIELYIYTVYYYLERIILYGLSTTNYI